MLLFFTLCITVEVVRKVSRGGVYVPKPRPGKEATATAAKALKNDIVSFSALRPVKLPTVCIQTALQRLDPRITERRGRAVESESEGILCGVGVGKNVPIPTPTSI
jgi:hypothetical protein